jgi:UDP-glucose 4-epimerase
MSVLVTGGAGYIGSHVVLELLDSGEETVVLDNLSTGFDWAVPTGATLVVGDVGDQHLVQRVIKDHRVDAIMHFAGSVIVPESITNPLAYYLNNTVKSHSLIDCAVKTGVPRFIFSSTAAVYGTPTTDRVSEDSALAPISPYGTSKMITEMMLRDAGHAHGTGYATLRYFNVAGADPQGRGGQSTRNATHLIKVAAQTALGQRPSLEIFGTDYPTPDGTCIRDYIHVSDLARAHLAALEHLRSGGSSLVLNCGYGRGFSVLEVIDAVERVSKTKIAVQKTTRRAGDSAVLVAEANRIREVLGWYPKLDELNTIVGHAFAWERQLTKSVASLGTRHQP